jgi:hypothetical protein
MIGTEGLLAGAEKVVPPDGKSELWDAKSNVSVDKDQAWEGDSLAWV